MITILILFQFSNISANYASKSMQNPNAESEVSISSRQALLDNALDMPETSIRLLSAVHAIRRQTLQRNGVSTPNVLTTAL